jgi:hypothetical protein
MRQLFMRIVHMLRGQVGSRHEWLNDSANVGLIWRARGLWPVPIEWSNTPT